MKKILTILLISICVFAFTSNTMAQTNQVAKKPKIGIGVSISDIKDIYQLFSSGPTAPQIFFPVKFSSSFMIEPGFGYFQVKEEGGSSESTTSIYSFGIGLFPMNHNGSLTYYYGIRLGLTGGSSKYEYSSGDYTDEEKSTISGYFAAPAVGAEYFFSEHFSLGGEAQFRYITYTEEEDGEDDSTYTMMGTRTLLFIRWYF
ncbi:hypothetical protein B6I21_06470 [candidate division KSB1 bacterium 4572_119]|nr:MAG: hypothetical protein B6I21_06470 [candidate division KSB1 bacterium 4572_119]